MTTDVCFFQSRNIKDYKAILTGLQEDFEKEHWEYLLTWCGIIDNDPADLGKYWQVWLIETQNKVVGICGMYSLLLKDNTDLWLGWFGVLPQYRGRKLGEEAIRFMEHEGRKAGAKSLLSYITPGEYPLRFYEKNGFVESGNMDEGNYLVITKKI